MKKYRKHLILKGSSIKIALGQLDLLSQDAILFVVDNEDILFGSLTDGDIRRGLIKGVSLDSSIDEIIQPNPRSINKKKVDINKIIEYREGMYRIIPILNDVNKVINIINFREIRSYLPIDAVIMAGGRGQRLMPLTQDTPKPLLKVGDKPIIEHNISRLAKFGIDDFWISINYLGELIEKKIGNGHNRNIDIKYVNENKPLGTIGAVSLIQNFNHDNILITNSDLLTNLDYESFFLDFLKNDADFSVATIPYNVSIPYAIIESKDNKILNFHEKPTYSYFANAGIYLMKKKICAKIPYDLFYNATDLLQNLIKENYKVISYPLRGYWLDIGNHEDYKKAQEDLNYIKF